MAKVTILREELTKGQEEKIVAEGKRENVEVVVDENSLCIHDLTDEQARQLESDFREHWEVIATVEK